MLRHGPGARGLLARGAPALCVMGCGAGAACQPAITPRPGPCFHRVCPLGPRCAGADPSVKDNKGRLPMDLADNAEVAQLLKDAASKRVKA